MTRFGKFGTKFSFREIGEGGSTETSVNTGAETRAKGASYSERKVAVSTADKALTVSSWHRGLALIGDTMGVMPVQYQRLNREGGNFIEDASDAPGNYLTFGTRLNYLLQVRPNPLMTAFELNKQAAIKRIESGNAFIYIERNAEGEPSAFWLANNGAYLEPTNQFILSYLSVGGQKVVTAPASDVIHLPNTFKYAGTIMGIPTLIHARNALSLAATSDALALENAAKGGRQKIIVREDRPQQLGGTLAFGRYNQSELQKKTQELNDAMYDNDVLLLTNALDIVNISQNAQQQELLESRKFTDGQVIGRFLGVPKILLMDDSGSSYKSPEAATQEFYMRTISPMAEQKEQEYDGKLLNVYDYGKRRFHVCEQPIFRLDPAGQADITKTRMESGTMTINEARAVYDLPAVENGDEPMASANLMTLKALMSKGIPEPGRPSSEGVVTPPPPPSPLPDDGKPQPE